MANPFVVGVISLLLAVIMVANVLIPVVKGTNTSTFSTAELAIWGVVTLGAIVGLAYSAFSIFGLA